MFRRLEIKALPCAAGHFWFDDLCQFYKVLMGKQMKKYGLGARATRVCDGICMVGDQVYSLT